MITNKVTILSCLEIAPGFDPIAILLSIAVREGLFVDTTIRSSDFGIAPIASIRVTAVIPHPVVGTVS